MNKRGYRGVTATLIVLLGAGCGGGQHESDEGVFFPTHNESDGPNALVEGDLGRAGSCVVVIANQGPNALPLWPDGYYFDDGAVLDGGEEIQGELSSPISLAGGFVSMSKAEELTGATIPSDCGQVVPYMVTEVDSS
jgi:hypothetical protein